MSWPEVYKINSDFNSPLNHLIWLNDYKTYGQNSYVYNDKDKWSELLSDYLLCMNDFGVAQYSLEYANTHNQAGKAFSAVYGTETHGTTLLDSCETIEDVYVENQNVFAYVYDKLTWLQNYVKTNKANFISLGLTILDTLKITAVMSNILLYNYRQMFTKASLQKIFENEAFRNYLKPLKLGYTSSSGDYVKDEFTGSDVNTFQIMQYVWNNAMSAKTLTLSPTGTWKPLMSGKIIVLGGNVTNEVKVRPEKGTESEVSISGYMYGVSQAHMYFQFFEGDMEFWNNFSGITAYIYYLDAT